MRTVRVLILILAILASTTIHSAMVDDAYAATVYYVDGANGNDGWPGTEAQPWKTITKAANTLAAGDTVYVRSGIYNERIFPANSGSAGNYITYKNYPGHSPTIDGAGIPFSYDNGLIHMSSKNYIIIDGFRIVNSDHFGVFAQYSDHITVQNCYFNLTDGPSVYAVSSSNITILSNDVDDVCIAGSNEGISLRHVNTFEIAYNHLHDFRPSWPPDNPDYIKEGIDPLGSSNGSVHHNEVSGTSFAIYLDAWSSNCSNVDVYNNITYNNTGNGISMNAERGGSWSNVNIYNNIAYSNTYHGIKINNEADSYNNIYIANNTVYDNNGCTLQIVQPGANIYNLVVENNIFGSSAGYGISFISGYNEAQHHFRNNHFQETPYYGSGYTTGNPLFVSPPSNLSLQSSSPGIDSGVQPSIPVSVDYNGASRPQGAGYDMGAYEYGGSAPPPPTNQPPVLSAIGDKSINEEALLQFTISATDPDDSNLSYSASNLPSGASFDTNTRTFSWTPSSDQAGTYSNVHFEVSDGNLTDSEDITITVNDSGVQPPPTDPPSIGFAAPTDPDNATVTRDWTEVNVSVSSIVDTSSYIDWNRSLVGYWDFDGDTADKSTYNNDGSSGGSARFLSGRYGSALELDAVDEVVNCGNDESLRLTDDWTVEFWIRPNNGHTSGDGHRPILTNLFGGDSYCRFHNTGYLQFSLMTSDGGQHIPMGGQTSWDDKWYHAVFIYDKSAGTLTKYIDGVQDGLMAEGITGNTNVGSNSLFIHDTYAPLNGLMDEVRIWNRALSQNEILASYNSTLNGLTTQLNNLSNGSYDYYAYTTDTAGYSAQTETRTITIAAQISEPPVLDPIGDKSVDEGQLLQFSVSATDPEGDLLSYSATNLPSGANFDPNTQVFSWTPDYSQEGNYSAVHFEVSDGQTSDSEDITIIVTDTNVAPVLDPIGNKSVIPGERLQFAISATDADDQNLIYAALNLPSGASFDAQTQTFSWTPNESQVGTHSNVHFEISDGELTDSEDITITVNQTSDVWDINQDGAVNVLDLIRIGQHWGETGSPGWIPEDVNQDGTIDVLDNIVIGQHWTS